MRVVLNTVDISQIILLAKDDKLGHALCIIIAPVSGDGCCQYKQSVHFQEWSRWVYVELVLSVSSDVKNLERRTNLFYTQKSKSKFTSYKHYLAAHRIRA